MPRMRNIEWHAVAGVVAAVAALVLHLLHVVDETVIFAVLLVLLAVANLGIIRGESKTERVGDAVDTIAARLMSLERSATLPDVVLIGPRDLRTASETFASHVRGEMTWVNVCLLMFVPQSLFDAMLRPAIENPAVSRIRFVLDRRDRELWDSAVASKLRACPGAHKVDEPEWRPIADPVSFILGEAADGRLEAHLSFWGEPFMSRSTGRDIPRYVFHVLPGSELIGRLVELERSYRISS